MNPLEIVGGRDITLATEKKNVFGDYRLKNLKDRIIVEELSNSEAVDTRGEKEEKDQTDISEKFIAKKKEEVKKEKGKEKGKEKRKEKGKQKEKGKEKEKEKEKQVPKQSTQEDVNNNIEPIRELSLDMEGVEKQIEELSRKIKGAIAKTKHNAVVGIKKVGAGVGMEKHKKPKGDGDGDGQDLLFKSGMSAPFYYYLRKVEGVKVPTIVFSAVKVHVERGYSIEDIKNGFGLKDIKIHVKYGDLNYIVHKKIADFFKLYSAMRLLWFVGKAPSLPHFPIQEMYDVELKWLRGMQDKESSILDFYKSLEALAKGIERYLKGCFKNVGMRPSVELCAFLELSAISLNKGLGWKGREGYMNWKIARKSVNSCVPIKKTKRKKMQWVAVRESFVAICDYIGSITPSEVILFDSQFNVTYKEMTWKPRDKYQLLIENNIKTVKLSSDNEGFVLKMYDSIIEAVQLGGFKKKHRFGSFAPERTGVDAQYFVDGGEYYWTLCDTLEAANDSIYIAGWWISPEIYLKRPSSDHEDTRLDRLLKRKAEEGVKIYIQIYKEVKVSLPINSAYTKKKLESLHRNIVVQRHPDHYAGGTVFWSHHEKIVVVDNKYAFVGGIDLCFGRWDSFLHRASDNMTGNVDISEELRKFIITKQIHDGQDYSNPRVKDFTQVHEYERTLVDRKMTPRLPWHDLHVVVNGQAALDIARHFINRWNFTKKTKYILRKNMPLIYPIRELSYLDTPIPVKSEYVNRAMRNGNKKVGKCKVQVIRSSCEWSTGSVKENSIHTAYCTLIDNAKHVVYIENQFFVSNASNSDWVVKNRIAQAMVNRIIRAHKEKSKFKIIVLVPLYPAYTGDVSSNESTTMRIIMAKQYQSICRGQYSIKHMLEAEGIKMEDYIMFYGLRNYDVIISSGEGELKNAGIEMLAEIETPSIVPPSPVLLSQPPPSLPLAAQYPPLPPPIGKKIQVRQLQETNNAEQPLLLLNRHKPFTQFLNKHNVISENYIAFKAKTFFNFSKGSPESFHTSSDSSVDKSSSESPVDGAVGSEEGSGTPEINLADVEDYDRPKRDIFLNAGVEFNPTTPRPSTVVAERMMHSHSHSRKQTLNSSKRNKTSVDLRSSLVKNLYIGNNLPRSEIDINFDDFVTTKTHAQTPPSIPSSAKSSIHDAGRSLSEKAADAEGNLHKPISKEALPTPAIKFVTEQVYVHAKMMIVDDRIAVVGSANINDRSMAGNRDSEIAVIIEDGDCVDSFMDSQPYQATRFAHGLRMKLCHEHLGLAFDEESFYQNPNFFSHSKAVMDPLSNEFLELWDGSARKNHEIFKNVFKCTPDDSVRTFADYKKFVSTDTVKSGYGHTALQPTETSKSIFEQLAPISGHLVPFPLDFLAGESLEPKINQPDYYVPIDVFI